VGCSDRGGDYVTAAPNSKGIILRNFRPQYEQFLSESGREVFLDYVWPQRRFCYSSEPGLRPRSLAPETCRGLPRFANLVEDLKLPIFDRLRHTARVVGGKPGRCQQFLRGDIACPTVLHNAR
jgi:hypothetical protein